ncbi:hypothetical protein FOZ63_006080, partial [Perkinsus olseni]
ENRRGDVLLGEIGRVSSTEGVKAELLRIRAPKAGQALPDWAPIEEQTQKRMSVTGLLMFFRFDSLTTTDLSAFTVIAALGRDKSSDGIRNRNHPWEAPIVEWRDPRDELAKAVDTRAELSPEASSPRSKAHFRRWHTMGASGDSGRLRTVTRARARSSVDGRSGDRAD